MEKSKVILPSMSYIVSLCEEAGLDLGMITFDKILDYLESRRWILNLVPEFYKTGINWNWQVLVQDPFYSEYINDEISTGLYGDNGEYPRRLDAIMAGLTRMLELYLLSVKDNRPLYFMVKNKTGVNKIGSTLLDIVYFIQSNPGITTSDWIVDREWGEFRRSSAMEYLNYIENRIKICLGL